MPNNPFISLHHLNEQDIIISESQTLGIGSFNRFPSVVNIDPAFKLKQEPKFGWALEDPETPKLCPHEEEKQSDIDKCKSSNDEDDMSSSWDLKMRFMIDEDNEPIIIDNSSKSVSDISLKIKKVVSSNNNSIQNEEIFYKEEDKPNCNIISIPLNMEEEEKEKSEAGEESASYKKKSSENKSEKHSDEDDLKFVFNLNLDDGSEKDVEINHNPLPAPTKSDEPTKKSKSKQAKDKKSQNSDKPL